jgi:aspartate/methionine/tyrosine aminotransferase
VVERLLTEAGIATIPLSAFYETPPKLTMLRLCIAKQDETLDETARRLVGFAGQRGTG